MSRTLWRWLLKSWGWAPQLIALRFMLARIEMYVAGSEEGETGEEVEDDMVDGYGSGALW